MKNETKISAGAKLAKELLYVPKHVADSAPEALDAAFAFCEDYKKFLDAVKTEREAVIEIIRLAKEQGYQEFSADKTYAAGDKIYFNNREKAIMCATIGTKPLEQGTRLMIAHIDSPRLDLKPNPLYESSELALLKTHYYGGIRKYQWVATPLSLHGVLIKANGESVQINIGEDAGDPVFCVSDLLPHLAGEQNKRTLADGIRGEELNIIIGSLPFSSGDAEEDEKIKNRVKLRTMQILNEKYGITERDFMRAEIEAVPAQKAADIGFDRALIGAYGHDDRVCAYTALKAEFEVKMPDYTTVCVLTDKEEVGSDGVSGLESDFLFHFLEQLANAHSQNYIKLLQSSKCLSADVNVAYDPTFSDVYEINNSAFVNRGVVVTKYTGARGKSSTNDAPAEYTAEIINLLESQNVQWQTGEMGKVDGGGGGTIAKCVGNRDVDTIDIGVPVLSMHAPFEIVSKLDVYMTYRAFAAFAGIRK